MVGKTVEDILQRVQLKGSEALLSKLIGLKKTRELRLAAMSLFREMKAGHVPAPW
jgi:hypothetical protein